MSRRRRAARDVVKSGLHVPPWSGRRRAEALAVVKRAGRRANAPCVLCNLPINYDLEYPDPASCSVQHIRSRAQYPELTWVPSNWAPAHLDCNRARDDHAGSLGLTSPW